MVVYFKVVGWNVKVDNWKIEYCYEATGHLSDVEVFLNKLTIEQLKSVAKELRILELSGSALRLPHSKSLGKGLFELRERKFGYRIYYTFVKNKVVVLLCAGDKSTQRKDIEKAKKRLANIMRSNYEN